MSHLVNNDWRCSLTLNRVSKSCPATKVVSRNVLIPEFNLSISHKFRLLHLDGNCKSCGFDARRSQCLEGQTRMFGSAGCEYSMNALTAQVVEILAERLLWALTKMGAGNYLQTSTKAVRNQVEILTGCRVHSVECSVAWPTVSSYLGVANSYQIMRVYCGAISR